MAQQWNIHSSLTINYNVHTTIITQCMGSILKSLSRATVIYSCSSEFESHQAIFFFLVLCSKCTTFPYWDLQRRSTRKVMGLISPQKQILWFPTMLESDSTLTIQSLIWLTVVFFKFEDWWVWKHVCHRKSSAISKHVEFLALWVKRTLKTSLLQKYLHHSTVVLATYYF